MKFAPLLLAGVLLALARPVCLHAQGGQSGVAFLKFGSGARAIAMGDAGVAWAPLSAGMHYNPALTGLETRPSISVMHDAWVQDISADALGAVLPLNGWTIGVDFMLLKVPGIEIRTVPGEATGTFDSQNFSAGLTVAAPLSDRLSVGASVKFLFEKILVDAAGGYAFDLGLAYSPFADGAWSRLKTGVALSNLGSMQPLRNESSKLPTSLRYGAAWGFPLNATGGDVNLILEGLTFFDEHVTHLNAGIEADYSKTIFLRAGYQSGYDIKGFSFGVGASWSLLRFDYAMTPFSDSFGASHTVTLSAIF